MHIKSQRHEIEIQLDTDLKRIMQYFFHIQNRKARLNQIEREREREKNNCSHPKLTAIIDLLDSSNHSKNSFTLTIYLI